MYIGACMYKMTQLLTEVVKEFRECLKMVQTLVQSDLFEIDNDLLLVDEKTQKLFCRLIYKIFYCTSRE